MSTLAWSVILQWSRVAVGAVVFLAAARFLTLAEIGIFATAFAPARLLQVVHRSGVVDAGILDPGSDRSGPAIFAVSLMSGMILCAGMIAAAMALAGPVGQVMAPLAAVALIGGIAAPSEARLRRSLRIRALALRTLVSHGAAAAVALWLLGAGAGVWSLVAFSLGNAALAAIIAVALAPAWPARFPRWRDCRRVLPAIVSISVREGANSAMLPVLQMAVGLWLGLPAAGAFQIAARLAALIDALAIAPIRYLALPRFRRLAEAGQLPAAAAGALRQTAGLAFLVYPGVLAAAPQVLTLTIGGRHAEQVAPLVPCFLAFGLIGALAMPVNQALTAMGELRLPLGRALATSALALALSVPGLTHSVALTAAALPAAGFCVGAVYLRAAAPRLGLGAGGLCQCLLPAGLAGLAMLLAVIWAGTHMPPGPAAGVLLIKACIGVAIYGALTGLGRISLPRARAS